MTLVWLSQARGLGVKSIGFLVASVVVAILAATVTVQLRTPADRLYTGPVLDSGVLVGLALPVSVLASLLQDRSAWLSVTSPRRLSWLRVAWLGTLLTVTLAVDLTIVAALPAQVPARLVAADFLALFALALGGGVILGRPLAWIPPALFALVCSVPGLVPIRANWLALADRAGEVGVLAVAGITVFGGLFVLVDEYGASRYRRVFERTPGVVDD